MLLQITYQPAIQELNHSQPQLLGIPLGYSYHHHHPFKEGKKSIT
jgi:hypothetical protein